MKTLKVFLNDIISINGISYLCVSGLDPKLKKKILSDSNSDNLEYELSLMTRGKVEKPGIFTLKNTDLVSTIIAEPKRLLSC